MHGGSWDQILISNHNNHYFLSANVAGDITWKKQRHEYYLSGKRMFIFPLFAFDSVAFVCAV